MAYVETFDRSQMMMCSWDVLVERESVARLIDAFVDSLNLSDYGVKEMPVEGRPAYDPAGLFKLYIYGYRKSIRSSRKLAESCKTNIEVKWMVGGVEPDFRTISDFRKINIKALKKLFHEFNRRISKEVTWGFSAIDGSKIQANNSKDNNFTKNKIDDRIKWLNAHSDEYLRILNDMDEQEEIDYNGDTLTKEDIEEKLNTIKERLERYLSYQKLMEEGGLTQLSITDADAKLMKNKNGFTVSFNPQTAVDSNTHIIRDFQMTNQVTDHGLMESTLDEIKKENPDEIIEAVADKGYNKEEDMINCLEKGIIPHVITDDGVDGYNLEVPYEEADADISSTKPEELKKALHSGKIPEAYKDVITSIEVREVRRKEVEITDSQNDKAKSIYGSEEEMIAKAKEGYFVRDPEANVVYCPMGEMLRQKSIKSNGSIRYSNKNACRHCKFRNKCYNGKNEWKEIDFTKDTLEKPCKGFLTDSEKTVSPRNIKKGKFKKVKIVRFFLKPNRKMTEQRMCLSEHPFGTIKRAMGSDHFLLKGLQKVEGEFALSCLGYNIERAKNLIGFEKMMKVMVRA